MATLHSKPYVVTPVEGDISSEVINGRLNDIDEMFDILFTDVSAVNDEIGTGGTFDPTATPIDLTAAAAEVTGILPVPNGGTGVSSFTAYAVILGGTTATGVLQDVGSLGSSGDVLTSQGNAAKPQWVTPAAAPGSTVPTTSQGDILYASAANTLSALAKSTSATRYLSNTGASNNPAWAQVDLTNGVTGDLPYANLAQGSALSVLGVTGNATADVASIVAANDGEVLRRSGTAVGFGSLDLSNTTTFTGSLPASALSVVGINVVDYTMTDSDIRTITTGVEISIPALAAPGANKTIAILSMYEYSDTSAGAYSATRSFALRYSGIGQNITNIQTLPLNTTTPRFHQTTIQNRNYTVSVANTAVVIISDGAALTGGNAANTVKLRIFYTIMNT